jgi:hypothetical protein
LFNRSSKDIWGLAGSWEGVVPAAAEHSLRKVRIPSLPPIFKNLIILTTTDKSYVPKILYFELEIHLNVAVGLRARLQTIMAVSAPLSALRAPEIWHNMKAFREMVRAFMAQSTVLSRVRHGHH